MRINHLKNVLLLSALVGLSAACSSQKGAESAVDVDDGEAGVEKSVRRRSSAQEKAVAENFAKAVPKILEGGHASCSDLIGYANIVDSTAARLEQSGLPVERIGFSKDEDVYQHLLVDIPGKDPEIPRAWLVVSLEGPDTKSEASEVVSPTVLASELALGWQGFAPNRGLRVLWLSGARSGVAEEAGDVLLKRFAEEMPPAGSVWLLERAGVTESATSPVFAQLTTSAELQPTAKVFAEKFAKILASKTVACSAVADTEPAKILEKVLKVPVIRIQDGSAECGKLPPSEKSPDPEAASQLGWTWLTVVMQEIESKAVVESPDNEPSLANEELELTNP